MSDRHIVVGTVNEQLYVLPSWAPTPQEEATIKGAYTSVFGTPAVQIDQILVRVREPYKFTTPLPSADCHGTVVDSDAAKYLLALQLGRIQLDTTVEIV